jgi:hypothetical protein
MILFSMIVGARGQFINGAHVLKKAVCIWLKRISLYAYVAVIYATTQIGKPRSLSIPCLECVYLYFSADKSTFLLDMHEIHLDSTKGN